MPNFVTIEMLEERLQNNKILQADSFASIHIGVLVFIKSLLESSEIYKNNMLTKINVVCDTLEKDKHGLPSPDSLLLDIRDIVSQSIAKEASNHPIV